MQMKYILKFIRLPLRVKRMLPEAVLYSAYYRYQILYHPFSRLASRIGEAQYETDYKKVEKPAVKEVKWAVAAVCLRTPWESKCLVRALTAKRMLNRRGLPCTLYMGVQPDKEAGMTAHAWLRCGDTFVTGGNGAKAYAVTAIFGDERPFAQKEG